MFKQMRWLVATILHLNAIVVVAIMLARNVIALTGLLYILYALCKFVWGI